jgi:hypothetical protein
MNKIEEILVNGEYHYIEQLKDGDFQNCSFEDYEEYLKAMK